MKIVVTHTSPDWDAIGGVWVLRKFLPGWQHASVEFVAAGSRSERVKNVTDFENTAVVEIGDTEIIHVDTGLGPLDHHQTSDDNVCGTSRAWDYVKEQLAKSGSAFTPEHLDAVQRIVHQITENDHFKEVFLPDADADYHDFSLLGVLEGLKQERPEEDDYYVEFGSKCLDAMMHWFVAKGWAEEESKKGMEFQTKWGKALGIETHSSEVTKLAQKKGYMVVVLKNPKRGNVSIKARPYEKGKPDVDLTLLSEKLHKIDPEATWYLHVSKKMLLNGSKQKPKYGTK